MNTRIAETLNLLPLALALVLAKYVNAPATAIVFLSLFAVLAHGYLIGHRWVADPFGSAQGRLRPQTAFLWGSLGSLALLMLIRGAWFYTGLKLDSWGDAWTTAIMLGLGCLWILLDPREISPLKSTDHEPRTIRDRIFILTSLALSLTGLLLIALVALNHGTTASIRTPWPLMPGWTLPLVGLL